MTDHTADDVISADEAAELLGVPAGQIATMVEEGLLTPVDDGRGGSGFARAEVAAARLLGG